MSYCYEFHNKPVFSKVEFDNLIKSNYSLGELHNPIKSTLRLGRSARFQ
jgi:hypothetical protein